MRNIQNNLGSQEDLKVEISKSNRDHHHQVKQSAVVNYKKPPMYKQSLQASNQKGQVESAGGTTQ